MPSATASAAVLLLLVGRAVGTINGFPNSLGVTPPMGWRSWNAFRLSINQSRITSIIDGITLRRWSINGTPTSLADLGYSSVGIDE